MAQRIITPEGDYRGLDAWLSDTGCRRLMLVCGNSIRRQEALMAKLERLEQGGLEILRFSDFEPNPRYESVVEGVRRFREAGCDGIMAVGGGSAMDVAKCVKLYCTLPGDGAEGGFLKQAIVPNDVPFLAMPTTAGTGSEATRFAVIYYQGQKQSVTHDSGVPGAVLLDPGCLKSLPEYQRKATMLDALCHAMESLWSVNSTPESMGYSREAIRQVLAHMRGYLDNTDAGNAGMLLAANVAGKAINITQTTAGHAMCYKITGLFGVSHGHAAMLCDRVLLPWNIENAARCTDPRGEAHLRDALSQLAGAMGCATPEAAARRLNDLFDALELEVPAATEEQYALLRTSVNPVRLKNHPIALDEATIDMLYHRILR